MSPARRGRCRYCGQPVVWVRTVTGSMMPINPMPDPGGNIIARAAADGGARAAVLNTSMQADPAYAGRERFMPHAATCPNMPRRTPGTGGSSNHEQGTQ
jgi:hypothetical protein